MPQAYQIERWGARVVVALLFAAAGLLALGYRLSH